MTAHCRLNEQLALKCSQISSESAELQLAVVTTCTRRKFKLMCLHNGLAYSRMAINMRHLWVPEILSGYLAESDIKHSWLTKLKKLLVKFDIWPLCSPILLFSF